MLVDFVKPRKLTPCTSVLSWFSVWARSRCLRCGRHAYRTTTCSISNYLSEFGLGIAGLSTRGAHSGDTNTLWCDHSSTCRFFSRSLVRAWYSGGRFPVFQLVVCSCWFRLDRGPFVGAKPAPVQVAPTAQPASLGPSCGTFSSFSGLYTIPWNRETVGTNAISCGTKEFHLSEPDFRMQASGE
jgi:hypothetical protein